MMKMKEKYPEGGDIDLKNLISGYNKDGTKFLITFVSAFQFGVFTDFFTPRRL